MNDKKLLAFFAGLPLALCVMMGASYGVFSPGGALSGTWNSQNVNLAAGGSFITGVTPVANGGTNLNAAADDNTMVGNGTTWQTKAVGSCSGATDAVTYNTTTNSWGCNTIAAGGTPGGSTTQVQYNNAGAFAGDADFTWNSATNFLFLGSTATPGRLATPNAITTTGNGADLSIRPGEGGSVSGNGGSLSILAGFPTDGNTGTISIAVGSAVGTNRTGGGLSMSAGNSTGNVTGGNATVQAGGGGATANGGAAQLIGGTATTGTGGSAVMRGGSVITSGAGGDATVTGGAGVGTNQNGGNVIIQPGAPTGSGTIGSLQFVNATATGANAATFTATNKPGAGAAGPTLWLRVVVSGTTYWIPLFGN